MDKNKALQNLLQGKITNKEIELLKQALESGEISIGGDMNRSVVIIGSGNKIELPPEALDVLKSDTKIEEPAVGEPPYMGLRYFDTHDADLFYGREELTRELLLRVKNESFLAIVGASGSGKSSVARAGLIPAWQKENEHSTIHVITPTAHPLESLAASLTRESESVTATSILLDDLMKDARSLRLYAKKTFGETKLLLMIDQFEEVFTLCKDLAEQKAFIENLLSLADENNVAHVIITLRADYYHRCAEYEDLRVVFEKHQAYIGAMTTDELRRAIASPAEKNEWDFQPGLVDLILSDINSEPGALPLLSHALLETWRRRQGRTLTLKGYHEAGGVKKAIAQAADRIYDNLTSTEQTIAREIFLRLTELGDGVQDTRRRVKISEFLQEGNAQDDTEKVLKNLIDARLITTERESVTVTHEALITYWDRLRNWSNDNRSFLTWRQKINDKYLDWQKNKGELLQGSYLIEAESWLFERGSLLSSGEKKYIEESIANKNKRQIMLRNVNFGFLLSYLILLILIGAIGFYATTRIVTTSLSERLTNQVMESGRTVSDSFIRKENQHVRDAFLVIYTEGLVDAVISQDEEKVLELVKPLFSYWTVESILIVSPQGKEVINLYSDQAGELFDVSQGATPSSWQIIEQFLTKQDPNLPPIQSFGDNPVNGEIYYYTTLPISVDGEFYGVISLGTSIQTLLSAIKPIALADIVLYNNDGHVIATTFSSTDDDLLRQLTISSDQYSYIINSNLYVFGENFETNGRFYTMGASPLQMGNNRISVFAVALPLDFVVSSNNAVRTFYVILFSSIFTIVILIAFFVWKKFFAPLYNLVEKSDDFTKKANTKKLFGLLLFFILSFGLILMVVGQLATRITPYWSVSSNMTSDLSLDDLPSSANILQPVSADILSQPDWVDTYLTPTMP